MAGVAHPRRQKHREMPPPGASAPAFAATVEPTFTQITSDLPPAYLQSDSSNERVLGMTCAVFPVYTLMRASILDFRPRLANRCKVLPVYALMRASILDFKPKLANRCSTIVMAVENGPSAMAVAATTMGCRRNHSSLPIRKLESDAENRCLHDRSRRNHSPLHRFASLGLKSRIDARRRV